MSMHPVQAEREARIAEEKAGLGPSQGAVEEAALQSLLQPLGLGIREIRVSVHADCRQACHKLIDV